MTAEEVVDLAFEMPKGRIKTEKERKEYMKKAFTVQMITEYQSRHNLECLQELYESAGFKDNRKLAEKLGTDRKILFGPYENEKHKDHSLKGRWDGFRECHIQPDWLLIYLTEDGLLMLTLVHRILSS